MYLGNPVTYIADCNSERVSGVNLTLGVYIVTTLLLSLTLKFAASAELTWSNCAVDFRLFET